MENRRFRSGLALGLLPHRHDDTETDTVMPMGVVNRIDLLTGTYE